jgi:hypothetical protein
VYTTFGAVGSIASVQFMPRLMSAPFLPVAMGVHVAPQSAVFHNFELRVPT